MFIVVLIAVCVVNTLYILLSEHRPNPRLYSPASPRSRNLRFPFLPPFSRLHSLHVHQPIKHVHVQTDATAHLYLSIPHIPPQSIQHRPSSIIHARHKVHSST